MLTLYLSVPSFVKMTPGPIRYVVSHVEDISPVHHTSYQKKIILEMEHLALKSMETAEKSMDETCMPS